MTLIRQTTEFQEVGRPDGVRSVAKGEVLHRLVAKVLPKLLKKEIKINKNWRLRCRCTHRDTQSTLEHCTYNGGVEVQANGFLALKV